jgi:hypothetical protein
MQPPPGPRIEDAADGVVVAIPARRFWGAIAFIALWLSLWTLGGLLALAEVPNAGKAAAFLVVWLCFWAAGECFAAAWLAWMLVGVSRMQATPSVIEVRKQIGPFARSKQYEAALVTSVDAVLVPNDEDEGVRRDYCVRISHRDEIAHVGEGLTADRAEEIATRVLETIRPRAWWDAEAPRPRVYVEPLPEPDRWHTIAGGLWIAALVVLVIVASRF